MVKLKPITNDSLWTQYYYLQDHNVNVVRVESRATHIARAFLKGKRFSSIERIDRPNDDQKRAIKRAKSIVDKYHSADCRVDKSTFNDWLLI